MTAGRSDDEKDAWLAFEEGRLEDAARSWSGLMASAASEEQRDRYLGHSAYVLVAQGCFDEARDVYRDLFERCPSHRHIHQLGMVEREAGNLEEALRTFDREAALLPEGDALALAANLYERALLHHLLHEQGVALELMEQCVSVAELSEDPTMIGVAYRLKGDVVGSHDASLARAAYGQALERFARAGDEFGVVEVERRLASLR